MRLLDLFSGIGGFSYAAEQIVGGFETVQFVEQNAFCQSILSKHWPDVPIHDDITTFKPKPGSADVICGGFPCQDISTAGRQAGIKEGTRSGLFHELMRVVRVVGPRFVVLENVAAITSNGLDIVLGELAEAGFDAEWACIPASAVGACHQRDRWWLVAYASSADRPRRAEGAGRRSGSAADAGGCGIPESSGITDDASHPANMLSNGGTAGHGGQPRGRAVPEPRDGGGAGNAADAINVRPCRQKLPLPAVRGSDERREAPVGGGQAFGAQQWKNWASGRQPLSPNWRSYVSEPVLCRGDDGLSGRVDRLKALGNAVVPQVAAIPLARVLELERSG
jgi:DNA (cytosine-5)-methyltransferase 1